MRQMVQDTLSSEWKFERKIFSKTPNKTIILQPYIERTKRNNLTTHEKVLNFTNLQHTKIKSLP